MKTRSSSRNNLNQKNAAGKKRDSPEPDDDDEEENSNDSTTTTPTRTRKRTKLMIAQHESDNEEESQSSSSIEVDESALLNLTDIFHIIIENELLEQYYPGALIALSLTRKDFYDCVFKHLVSGGLISQDKPEHLLNALRVRFSKASKTCLFCNENRAQLLPQFGFYVHTSKCKEAIHRHMINVYYPLKKENNPCFSKEQLLTALPHATLTGNSKYSGKYEFNVVWENDDGFLPRNQTLEGFLAGDISDREIKQKTEAIKAEREAEVRRKQEKRMEADRKRLEKINTRRTVTKEKLRTQAINKYGVHEEVIVKFFDTDNDALVFGDFLTSEKAKCEMTQKEIIERLKAINQFHERNLLHLLDPEHELNSRNSSWLGTISNDHRFTTIMQSFENHFDKKDVKNSSSSSSLSVELFLSQQVDRMKSKLQQLTAPTMPCLFDEIFNDPEMNEKVFGDFFAIEKSSKSCNNVNQISERVFLCMKEKLLKIALQEGMHKETFEKYGVKLIGKRSVDKFMKYLKVMDKYQGLDLPPPFEIFYEDWNGWKAVQYDECKDHLRRFINGKSTKVDLYDLTGFERKNLHLVCEVFGFGHTSHGGWKRRFLRISRKDDYDFESPRVLSTHEIETFL